MNKLTIQVAFILTVICSLISCEKNDPKELSINRNIVLLDDCCDGFYAGDYRMGIWKDSFIFYIAPLSKLQINNSFQTVDRDSLIGINSHKSFSFIDSRTSSENLLLVHSIYSDVSVGSLYEYIPATNQSTLLLDSTYAISSAVYMNDGLSCIYYSYGNTGIGHQAGYYYLNLLTLQDSLVYAYTSVTGPYETINGFDISPDNSKLLIPLHYVDRSPKLIELNLSTLTVDTLQMVFERQFVWARYNSAGSQIVYSNYPIGVGSETIYDDSEIGIIDLPGLSKRVLDVNTNTYKSVNVFPTWSPGDKHIIYGSAKGPAIEPPGAKGNYSLYLLKNVN